MKRNKIMNIFETDDNSTPLTEEEKQGLKAGWITNRSELNEMETAGIAETEIWLMTNKKDILSESFLKTLHKKMFGEVWLWAGSFRTTERNIGIAPYNIQPELRKLFDDIKYWIEECLHNKIDNFEEKCYECGVKKLGRIQNQRIAMELNSIPFAVNSEVRSSLRFFEIMIEILMKFLEKNTSIAMAESDNYDDIIKDLFLNSAFFRDKSERKEQRK